MQRGRVRAAGRDGAIAALASIVGCAALAWVTRPLTGGWALTALAGAAGVGVASVGWGLVLRRTSGQSTVADRITLTRGVLAGLLGTATVAAIAGRVEARSWALLLVIVPALLLDAVDGRVARRDGNTTPDGSRLDMETDAVTFAVLSVLAGISLAWWVVAIGGMRYAFVGIGAVRPGWRNALPFSAFRRWVAGLQGVALAVGLAPVVPIALGRIVVGCALALLIVSFARDIRYLERLGRQPRELTTADPTICS